MKNIISLLVLTFLLHSCKTEPKTETPIETPEVIKTISYPDHVSKIFKAHGGIDAWNAMESLSFDIEKPNVNDKYTVALKSRKSLITSEHHLLGFDGDNVWLKHLDTVQYKSNPKFYYNLMFYFYAMPFVLGDDGIQYADAEPLEFEGKTYNGILVSYDNGIGESPEDEYILYYNPETYQMEWLGYTVTYFSKEKGKEFHFIKYSDWQDVNDVKLPKTLSWYNYENNKPTDFRNDVNFTNVYLSKTIPNGDMFKAVDTTYVVQ